ncbi:MAG: hypothetical protein AAFQ94_20340 [Bacteroidota bacterium]
MKIKKNYFNPLTALLLTLFSSAVFFSCSETEEPDDQIMEQVQYELEEGNFVTVQLDPNFDQQSREFVSMEEYEDQLDQLEEAGDIVTVNKSLYEELSHYFDPYEISLLDNNRQVEIGGILYRTDQVAAYKKVGNSWEKIVHFGEDGMTDLNETSMIYDYLDNLQQLDDYDFKSPAARAIYERLKGSSSSPQTEAHSEHVLYITQSNLFSGNPFPCQNCENFAYTFTYPWNGNTIQAQLRVIVWNEENAIFGSNAKSGTKVQIMDVSSNGRFGQNWTTPGDGTRIGNGTGYRPYVYVKHVTSNNGGSRTKKHKEGFGFKWNVSVQGGRKNGWKTLSNHSVDFRDPSFSQGGLPLYRILTVDRFDDNLGDL